MLADARLDPRHWHSLLAHELQLERDYFGEDEVVLVQVVQVIHLLGAGSQEDLFLFDSQLDLERTCWSWMEDHLGLTDVIDRDHSLPYLN